MANEQMTTRLQRPTDPYDPLWTAYAAQNPGLRRSLSAADPEDPADPADPGNDSGTGAIDLGAFVPESFKGEDGAYDTAGFRARFDELTAAQQQAEERKASLPKSPDEYAWALPEGFTPPEGLDLSALATKNEKGEDVPFDPASMLNADDPDVKALQAVMHGIAQGEASPQEAMQKMAAIMVGREMRQTKDLMAAAAEEAKALGADGGKARIETIKRSVSALVPAEQATALLDGLTTANAVRAVEALIKKSAIPPNAQGGTAPDFSSMSPAERVREGLKAQSAQ